VLVLLLFFRMEYLMNSEHFYFPTVFTTEIRCFIFSDRNIRLAMKLLN
jgi:hypothetical protein